MNKYIACIEKQAKKEGPPPLKESAKGTLHEKLNVPKDQKLPLGPLRKLKERALSRGDKKLGQRANYALQSKMNWKRNTGANKESNR